jgi:hypothetical protein
MYDSNPPHNQPMRKKQEPSKASKIKTAAQIYQPSAVATKGNTVRNHQQAGRTEPQQQEAAGRQQVANLLTNYHTTQGGNQY